MRLIIALSIALTATSVQSLAQKNKLREAKNLMGQTPPDANSAKTAIDAAIGDETTKNTAETWFVRGQVYTALKCPSCFETAYQCFQKAEELDLRNEYKIDIETKQLPMLSREAFNYGVERYQASDYTGALSAFELFVKIAPTEPSGMQNAAMSAEGSGDFMKAVLYYRQMIDKKYATDKTYESIARSLIQLKDTAGALTALKDGRFVYPDSVGLLVAEINLFLSSGRGKEALSALDQMVIKDPGNISCYQQIGIIHMSLAHPTDAEGNSLPLPSDHQVHLAQAEEAYSKGLAIDPSHFELNFNLGVLYFNEGVESDKQANGPNVSDAEYKRLTGLAATKYGMAAPYLEKAAAARPDDVDVLSSLKMLYSRTKETAKYEKVKADLDRLKH